MLFRSIMNEGYVVHSPNNARLLWALLEAKERPLPVAQDWELISDRTETVKAVRSFGAKCSLASEHQSSTIEYLSLSAK